MRFFGRQIGGKNAPEKTPDMARPAGRHEGLAAADPYAFQVSHRRLAWMLRISMGTNVVLSVLVAVTVSATANLFPLKEVRLALVHEDVGDKRRFRVTPITEEVEGFDIYVEREARRYVDLIVPIDPVSQRKRMLEAFAMTGDDFYKRFRQERIESGIIQEAIKSGLTREVLVESADRVEKIGNDYKYAIDFMQRDSRGGEVVEEKLLRAYLLMGLRPSEVPEEEKYKNPLGLVVLDMVLKERPGR